MDRKVEESEQKINANVHPIITFAAESLKPRTENGSPTCKSESSLALATIMDSKDEDSEQNNNVNVLPIITFDSESLKPNTENGSPTRKSESSLVLATMTDSKVEDSEQKNNANVLPIITFASESLKSNTENWRSTCKSVTDELEKFGYFIAVCEDGELRPEPELLSSVFSSLKELFNLPKETKSLYKSDLPGFGYVGETPEHLAEAIGIEDSTTLEAVRSFSDLMWPYGNDNFCDTIHRYATHVSKLGDMVTRMIFESYGVEKYCDAYTNSSSYLLRGHSYKTPKENDTHSGAIAHTDPTFISILQQDEVPGLEVQHSKDEPWIPVNFPSNSLVIMAGDALYAWSNGKIKQCLHRVIMGEKERMSVGLFSYHKGILHVPQELADEDSFRFASFDHLGMLKFRATEKSYCGVIMKKE